MTGAGAVIVALAAATAPAAPEAPAAAAPAAAAEAPVALDLATIDSKRKAGAYARTGKLVRVAAFPTELGAPDNPANILYLPPAAAEARDRLVETLIALVEDGVIDQLRVIPDYRGTSIIPTRLTFKAWHSQGPGEFEATLEIW